MKEVKKLFTNSFIIFVGATIGSVFSYLFNMMMGRMLGPELYGDFSALLSLLIIVSAGGTAVITVSMKYSSDLYAKKNIGAIFKLFKYFTKYLLYAGALIFIVGLLLINPIADFLSISNKYAIIIVLASMVVGLIIMVNKGILQGVQNFKALSTIAIIEMVLRLAIGLLLVYVGFALYGAVLALVVATFLTYLWSFKYLSNLFKGGKTPNKSFRFNKNEILGYSWPTLVTAVLLTLLLNVDILLVKHYFNPYDAGLYAAVSTVAKIIFYLTGPVVGVMFPMISEKKAKKEKHYNIFLFSLLATLILGLIVLSIYAVAPGSVIKLLYGAGYVGLYSLLVEVGLVMLLYALINLMANYFMAIKDFFFVIFMAIASVAVIVVVTMSHASILLIVRELIVIFAILLFMMIGYYLFSKREQILLFLNRGENGKA